ncbi:ATP-dependent RNA helicase DHX30-like [Spodoptera frugiperda]|uniref:ATP-dependent RNA helicase DHX30-like n=1 Tax=Spodoptera frugiperda TaxID=7108 RepID=A0A9R0DI15_SPOFR|nr:ATP-dependent RNA helicase DHX30-like [Spodoptera frugiperda]
MFLCKNFVGQANLWRKLLTNHAASNILPSFNNYSGLAVCSQNRCLFSHKNERNTYHITKLTPLHRKWCSRGLLDGDAGDLLTVQHNRVQKKITDLFPMPRATLNELTSKTPNQIFEIHYKQNTVAPKGRKKVVQNNDWTCTYTFVWPEKKKFESTAISKRKAADKAATQAIHWLFINKRIDAKGCPVYDKNVLDDIKKDFNEPLEAAISDKSVKLIEKIWKEYESGIKDIYEATFKEARQKMIEMPAVVTKDSTIDEDDFSEEETDAVELEDDSELKQHVHPVYGRNVPPPTKAALERRDRALTRKFKAYDEDLTPLPIDEYRDQIISTLEQNRVAVIVGAAGCGKSTRAPAAILRHYGATTSAIVSEPRRVAAMGLAERVASELGEEVGESIGYQVRLHSKPPKPPGGSILYCTSGVLLRRLQANPGLEGCTHVIIDEAHERDVNTDVTLLLLKRALDINPTLKVIIMSATLDTGVFTKYFNECPIVEVPGRTFPVEVSYLEDIQKRFGLTLPYTTEMSNKEDGRPQVKCQEVAELIKAVDKKEKEGAILVFLPGWSEIKLTKQLLDEHYGQSSMHMILPVHSRLSTTDQAKMFATPSPGIRKIVLATNVAETSITIPDVVYVIDSGAHKENRIKDGTGTASLETVWVSLAGAKQRTGRAGRVQPGHCYRMYSKEKEADFVPHTTPEILRIPLVQTVLDCKSYAPHEKIASFLSQLPEPPSDKSIRFAVNDLVELGALTPSEQLTRLGSILSSVSLHPRLAHSVLQSTILGNVVAATYMAAHCSTHTELFWNAADRRDEIREIKRSYSQTSDYGALYWIQEEFDRISQESGREGSDKYCEKYGLRGDRLAYIRSLAYLHLEQILNTSIIAPTTEAEELNRFSDIDELLCGSLIAGADALLTTRKHVKTKGKLKTVVDVVTSTGDRAHIGTESVNYNVSKQPHSRPHLLAYFGGTHSVERRALVVYRTCLVPPHTPLLFCLGDVKKEENGDTTMLTLPKHHLHIHVPNSQADSLLKLREMLWKTFEYHIERDLQTLDFNDHEIVSKFKVRLVKTIGRVLVEAHKQYIEGKSVVGELSDVEFR